METKKYSLVDFGVARHEAVLENGLKVVFIEKPFAPIHAQIMMRAGSLFDPIGKDGLAHFTEHCILNGSKTYNKEEMSGIIESVGGYKNARTAKEWMSVDCEIALVAHMSNMKEYFTQALTSVYITENLIIKEKSVVISEIERANSNRDREVGEYVYEKFANDSVWKRKNLGTIETVSSLTIEDVEAFFVKYCVVENMVLVIAGGCSWDDIKETFSGISFLRGQKYELPPDPNSIVPQKITYVVDVPQTKIFFGFIGPKDPSRESMLLGLVMRHAHQGFTSRFYKKIRNERGLAYSVSYDSIGFDTLYYFGTGVGVPTDRVEETITVIKECYQELLLDGMSQKEIQDKTNTMWFSAKRNMETSESFVDMLAFDELYPSGEGLFGSYPDIYNYRETFTVEEIKAVLEKYITLDSAYLVVSGRSV